jgi:hypothetical protein
MQLSTTPCDIDDFDLARRIVSFLHSRRLPDVARLRIETAGERVVLRGSFRTNRERELCLELIRHVHGVIHIDDQTELEPVATRPSRFFLDTRELN